MEIAKLFAIYRTILTISEKHHKGSISWVFTNTHEYSRKTSVIVFVNAHETLRLWCILDIVNVEFVLFITYYPWSFIKLLALHAIAIINFLQVKLSYVVVVWDSVFLVGNCPGANFLCGNCPVGNCLRGNYLGAIFRGRLSKGIFLSPKK